MVNLFSTKDKFVGQPPRVELTDTAFYSKSFLPIRANVLFMTYFSLYINHSYPFFQSRLKSHLKNATM